MSNKKNALANEVPTKSKEKFGLIAWDKKTKIFIGVCIILCLLSTFSKLHLSSIPIWNQVANDGGSAKRGLIAGTPQSIRSDEWLGQSTFILSQVKKDFTLDNKSLGPENSPLVMSIPVKHFITIFKPNLFPFLFLDEEYAYSWSWNFKVFGLLISVFLALMLLTGNNFLISLIGTLWMLLSSGIQWWFSTYLPEMISVISAIFVLTVYVLYTPNIKKVLVCLLLLFYFGVFLLTILYPPYLIPLIYLFFFLVLAYVLKHLDKDRLLSGVTIKVVGLVLVLVGVLGIFYLYYLDIKNVVELMTNTVYPGKRIESGGTGFTSHAFSEYFAWFMDAGKYPQKWSNICELSHFISFTPIILFLVIFTYIRNKKYDIGLVVLLVFQLLGYIYMVIGFPLFLSKITLLSMCPAYRVMVPLGVSNVFVTCLFLSNRGLTEFKKVDSIIAIGASVIILVISVVMARTASENFFTSNQMVVVILLFTAISIMLVLNGSFDKAALIFGVLLIGYSIKNLGVNPLSRGLKPVRANNISKTVEQLNAEDPGKWVVFGQFTFSNFINAAGADVVSGVKFAPMFDYMKVLDPHHKKDSIYNRYAHNSYYSMVTPNDSVGFYLIQSDHIAISVDPCSPKMKELGVKYFVFTYQPNPVEVRCLKLVAQPGILIYKSN